MSGTYVKVLSAPATLLPTTAVSVTDYGSIQGRGTSSAAAKSIEELPDDLSPPFSSPERESSSIIATFNLLSTILGGGALSIPFAFAKCGWLGGILILMFSVQISLFALELLCTLARKLGCQTYSGVVRKTMGKRYAELLDAISFGMLFLVLIAFLILIKDISGDIIEYVFLEEGESLSRHARSLTLYIITLCMLPLMMAESLHALRHVSYLGISSVLLLLCVITAKAVHLRLHNSNSTPAKTMQARLGPTNLTDVFTALPIILIAFLCQFNVVGVYAKLSQPTGVQIKSVLTYTTYISGFLYALFGVSGYFIAFDNTRDNILNNFSSHDPSLVVARIGLVLTLVCQTPMVCLPCIDSLLKLLDNLDLAYKSFLEQVRQQQQQQQRSEHDETQSVAESELEEDRFASTAGGDEHVTLLLRWKRTISTLCLVVICLFFSESVPGVSAIWTVAGSSISLILAFLFPSVAYLSQWYRLRASCRVLTGSVVGAFVLLGLSVFMICLCTAKQIVS